MGEVEVTNHAVLVFARIHAHRGDPEAILDLDGSDLDGAKKLAHFGSFSNLGVAK